MLNECRKPAEMVAPICVGSPCDGAQILVMNPASLPLWGTGPYLLLARGHVEREGGSSSLRFLGVALRWFSCSALLRRLLLRKPNHSWLKKSGT
jgi:hypothetical protein